MVTLNGKTKKSPPLGKIKTRNITVETIINKDFKILFKFDFADVLMLRIAFIMSESF